VASPRFPAVLVSFLFFSLTFLGSVSAQGVTRGITYTSGSQKTEQGDLCVPSGSGPFPVILYLHGGSWRSGGRGEFKQLATDLAAHGYASFAIDYDLSPHSFPHSWNEAREALTFLRSHASEYHLDPNRMIAAGTSAGGELAALLALAPTGPAGSSDPKPLPVAAAIILNGVFDLHGKYHVITRYLGADCQTAPAICDDASPDNHVHPAAPPFFVGHGTSDHVVPYAEAQSFIARLQAAGDAVTPFTAQGGPHMYWEKKPYYTANLAAIEGFLTQLPATSH
jgi:acetyl esterase/lipase